MNKAMQAAQKATRKAIESTYTGAFDGNRISGCKRPRNPHNEKSKSCCFGKSALQAVF